MVKDDRDLFEVFKDHDGEIIVIDSMECRIKCSEHRAIYPRPHIARYVSLEPVHKNSKRYLKIRNELGDDWTTDGLNLQDGDVVSVCNQLLDRESSFPVGEVTG